MHLYTKVTTLFRISIKQRLPCWNFAAWFFESYSNHFVGRTAICFKSVDTTIHSFMLTYHLGFPNPYSNWWWLDFQLTWNQNWIKLSIFCLAIGTISPLVACPETVFQVWQISAMSVWDLALFLITMSSISKSYIWLFTPSVDLLKLFLQFQISCHCPVHDYHQRCLSHVFVICIFKKNEYHLLILRLCAVLPCR